ncbi:MAG TPA: energy-coupling factor transporter ATPase [Candidatus Binataceae bacterium]|nr:energy-coupling factor transporter ATPase [Candidatus Binataceae bacterium]
MADVKPTAVNAISTASASSSIIENSNASPSPNPAAALSDIVFTYHGKDSPALDGVSLALKPGAMIGVMGASGAGKSTIAKCLNRIVPAFEGGDFSGIVKIGSLSLDGAHVCEAAPLVGMVFQDFEAQLFSTNVAHEVAFAMEQVGLPGAEIRKRIGPALDSVGLHGFDNRDPTSLSGGEKQRLAIASVLALRPAVIVLDEPTTDLDPEGRAEIFRLIHSIRQQGLSLIVCEHEAEELARCDHLVVLDEGTIVLEGLPSEVLRRLDELERYGVHPPDLNHILAGVGVNAHASSLDEAEQLIRNRMPQIALSPSRTNPATAEVAFDDVNTPLSDLAGASPIVEVEKLGFAYEFGPPVLSGIDLTIAPGEFLAIVGQNGSGKTTLAKLIVGLVKPSSGRILIEGRDRAALSVADTARDAAYVFQNPDHQIFAATVEDEVAFGPRNFGLDADEIARRCDEVLRAVNLMAQRHADPFLLSKGERQRLAVASVLALRPRLLILDEPTTGLDYREQRRMMALVSELNRSGIAIVMITHTPWLVAEYARRVVLMRHGEILYDGSVDGLFDNPALLEGSSFRLPAAPALAARFGFKARTPAQLISKLLARSNAT